MQKAPTPADKMWAQAVSIQRAARCIYAELFAPFLGEGYYRAEEISGFTNLSSIAYSDLGCWDMRKQNPVPQDPSTDPVSLASAAVHSLIQLLPSGTAFFIGVVLMVMMTGRLVHHKGSLARAALPFVVHLRWGWHRVERAMERGKVALDVLFDHAYTWCLANLPVEPVRLGVKSANWWPSTRRPSPGCVPEPVWPWPGRASVTVRGARCGPTSSPPPPASS